MYRENRYKNSNKNLLKIIAKLQEIIYELQDMQNGIDTTNAADVENYKINREFITKKISLISSMLPEKIPEKEVNEDSDDQPY